MTGDGGSALAGPVGEWLRGLGPAVPLDTASAQPWMLGLLVARARRGALDVSPPYQRGDVWTPAKRLLLVRSLLEGMPVPGLVIAARGHDRWALIDGKQRVTTMRLLLDGDLPFPASWISLGLTVEGTRQDGGAIRWDELPPRIQTRLEEQAVPVTIVRAVTIAQEAEAYLRVNGLGEPQAQADLDRAAALAGGGPLPRLAREGQQAGDRDL